MHSDFNGDRLKCGSILLNVVQAIERVANFTTLMLQTQNGQFVVRLTSNQKLAESGKNFQL
jgi:hypothetical protein